MRAGDPEAAGRIARLATAATRPIAPLATAAMCPIVLRGIEARSPVTDRLAAAGTGPEATRAACRSALTRDASLR